MYYLSESSCHYCRNPVFLVHNVLLGNRVMSWVNTNKGCIDSCILRAFYAVYRVHLRTNQKVVGDWNYLLVVFW